MEEQSTLKRQDLGTVLRERRKQLNLTIKEVETATSIRSSYLKAIEEGHVSQAINPVYAQGFVRQYATFLNLDAEQLIQDYPNSFAGKEHQDFAYGIGTLEMRNAPSQAVDWAPNILKFIVIGALALSAWALARYLEVL